MLASSLQPRAFNRGQTAIGFLVIMGFALAVLLMILNLGQMAQVRTETSNAADAGALAAASWMASGQNEAALIAEEKIWQAVDMIQAIYLIAPFCPDPVGQPAVHRAYADALWQSLTIHPSTGAYGPVLYFRDVADDFMIAAWNVGRRESFTAVVNNMMIRYPSYAVVSRDGDGNVQIDRFANVSDLFYPQQTLADQVRPGMGMFVDGYYSSLLWSTPSSLEDPFFLHHGAGFRILGYPDRPPVLELRGWKLPYWQYKEGGPIPDTGGPQETCPDSDGDGQPDRNLPGCGPFECLFKGRGIDETWPGSLAGVAAMNNVILPPNPLAINGIGRKAWAEIDLTRIVPRVHELRVRDCAPAVCGYEVRETALGMVPDTLSHGAGTVSLRVSHEVVDIDASGNPMDSIWTHFTRRFTPVASEAVAEYTPAVVFPSGQRVAKAQLREAR